MAKNRTDYARLAFWQLLEDDDVQQQLRTSATRLREAGQRFSRLPRSRVVEDKTLYDKVRESAAALAQALKLLGAEPEPPKKHRGLQLLVLAVTAGAVTAIVKSSQQPKETDHGNPQGQGGFVPQGAGAERQGAPAGAGAA